MKTIMRILLILILIVPAADLCAENDSCTGCHEEQNPGLVADWKNSAMSTKGLQCETCHGDAHTKAADSALAKRPNIATCERCHKSQAKQFREGKHALCEAALTTGSMSKKLWKKAPEIAQKSCAVCHLTMGENGGQCDACHTRHRFSAKEAKKPEACLPCHVDNHPQYESYYNSKHGAVYKAEGLAGRSPTCATCHMDKGNHKVLTSWGFFGVRKEEPDKKHAEYQKGVMSYLEKLGPVLAPNSHRATLNEWQDLRNDMLDICSGCHARSFCWEELEKSDDVVKKANCIANDIAMKAKKLQKNGKMNEEELFWLFRNEVHAQRMSLYINAFHQYPEGVLTKWLHLQQTLRDVKKKSSQNQNEK